jgi:hypothetical protein
MFRIMHVSPTDYDASNNREELQKLADDLNRDARADTNKTSRWIVVDENTVGDLFNTKH